ncbi:MAG: hypothetical protein R6U11_00510 [Bacteroidales bacterium]
MTSTYVGRGWGWWRLCRHQPHPDKNPWMSCHFDRREKSRNLYRTTKFIHNKNFPLLFVNSSMRKIIICY